MIKIASDRYAAFGVGKNVTLKEVKEVLLQVYYQVPLIAPKNKTKEEVLALITTSQVAIFNRS